MPPKPTNMSNEAIRRRLREKLNYRGARVDGTTKTTKRGKYQSRSRWVDGHYFPSNAEATRYEQLKEMLQQGIIDELELQPAFPCRVNGHLVCTYRADFRYRIHPGKLGSRLLIEDVKGVETPVYTIKRALVHALYAVQIIEIRVPKKGGVGHCRLLTADQLGQAPKKEEAWPRMTSIGSQRSSSGSQS